MDKLVTVDCRVRDMSGLYFDLKKAGFQTKNVGGDFFKTHVYLDTSEEKDPTPIVKEWATRPAPTQKELAARSSKMRSIAEAERAKQEALAREEEKAQLEAEKARQEAEQLELAKAEAEKNGLPIPQKEEPSLIKRIFRKLW